MNLATVNGLMGGLGGLAKSIFGLVKAKREDKKTEFEYKMTLVTILEGAVAGIVLGFVIPGSPVMAFLGGLGVNEIADLNDLFFPKNTR